MGFGRTGQALAHRCLGFEANIYVYDPFVDQLLELDNVLLTPHNAALTLECRKRMAVETCQNILYYLNDPAKLNKNNIVNRKELNL